VNPHLFPNYRPEGSGLLELCQVVRVRPGDVISVKLANNPTNEVLDAISTHLRGIWPDNRVLVLSAGSSIEVISPADSPDAIVGDM